MFAVSGLASALFAVWISSGAARREVLARLPEPERRALYERTLHALTSTCQATPRSSGLEDFCREQAQFVLRFPECDASCRALSQGLLAAASH